MSSYGRFILEVKQNDEWKRIIWKSSRSVNPYASKDEESQDGDSQNDDYVHRFVTIGNYYRLRDCLRDGEFGHPNSKCTDFTKETLSDIEEHSENGGWYEGYFYLKELETFISEKEQELEDFRDKSLLHSIYDEVINISAKLEGIDLKDKKKSISLNEYYEEDLTWMKEEISTLSYLSSVFWFMTEETAGYTNANDIRIIVIAD